MVFQIPVDKPLHARFDRCLRVKSHVLHQFAHIGEGGGNISGLHGQEVLLSLFSQGPLDEFDQIKQLDRLMVSEIVNLVRGAIFSGGGCGRFLLDPEYPFDHVVDVGEITLHLAVVVNVDRTARQDGLRELEEGHVRPSPRSVNREKTKSRAGNLVQVAVGVGHQFVGSLGGGIQADRMVNRIGHGKRCFLVSAVDGTGRGIHEVPYRLVPAALQNIGKTQQVAVDVGVGVVQGVPDTRLRCQVDDSTALQALKDFLHRSPFGDVHPVEMEATVIPQLSQAVFFESHGVVVIEVIDSNDFVVSLQ